MIRPSNFKRVPELPVANICALYVRSQHEAARAWNRLFADALIWCN